MAPVYAHIIVFPARYVKYFYFIAAITARHTLDRVKTVVRRRGMCYNDVVSDMSKSAEKREDKKRKCKSVKK